MKTEIVKQLLKSLEAYGMTVNQVALRLREIGIDLNIYETIADQDERSDCAFWGRQLYALKSDPNSNPVAIELVWDKFKRI